jgi:hypothetical protein
MLPIATVAIGVRWEVICPRSALVEKMNDLAAISLSPHEASQPVQEFSHGSGSYSRCEGDHRGRIAVQFRGVSLAA